MIKLPQQKNIKNVYWMYCITVPSFNSFKTEKLMKELLKKGIETRKMFIPYNLKKFRKKEKKDNCPKANKIAFNSFYLPSGVDLKKKDIKYISDCLIEMV